MNNRGIDRHEPFTVQRNQAAEYAALIESGRQTDRRLGDSFDHFVRQEDERHDESRERASAVIAKSMGGLDVMEEDLEDNYRRDLAGTDRAETLLFDSVHPEATIAEMDHAAATASIFLDAIKKPSEQRYTNIQRNQRSRIALNEARFKTFSRWQDMMHRQSKADMAALERVRGLLKSMAHDRIQEWSNAVDRAIKVRRDLDQIARAVSEEETRRADAAQDRELAAKARELELFIDKMIAEVNAEKDRAEINRGNSSAETENQIKQRRARSEAALAELEAYAKHRLTGQGEYYRFTRHYK